MRVLITGNMGYVGSTLVRHLSNRFPDAELVGLDSGPFAHCLTTSNRLPEALLARQIFADVRDVDVEMLRHFDSVVHLAAVSNDPMSDRFADDGREPPVDGSGRHARGRGRREELRLRLELPASMGQAATAAVARPTASSR